MKTQIRQSIFETNSSSIHSIAICSDETFTDWVNGRVKYKPDTDEFMNTEDADQENEKKLQEYSTITSSIYDIDVYDWSNYYLSYNEYFSNYVGYYETYEYSSKGVTAFGYYGHD